MTDSPGKKGSDAKAVMIAAARKLFQTRGYEGVGIAELLVESGAPRGSLYFHFPGGKEQIAVEAVATEAKRVEARLAGLRERKPGFEDYIDKVLLTWGATMEASDYSNGCVVAMVALELSSRSEKMAAVSNAAFALWEAELAAAALDWGMSDANAVKFAEAAMTTIEGAVVVCRVKRTMKPFKQAAETLKALAREYLVRA